MAAIQPHNIGTQQDVPLASLPQSLQTLLGSLPANQKLSAAEINTITGKLTELIGAANTSVQGVALSGSTLTFTLLNTQTVQVALPTSGGGGGVTLMPPTTYTGLLAPHRFQAYSYGGYTSTGTQLIYSSGWLDDIFNTTRYLPYAYQADTNPRPFGRYAGPAAGDTVRTANIWAKQFDVFTAEPVAELGPWSMKLSIYSGAGVLLLEKTFNSGTALQTRRAGYPDNETPIASIWLAAPQECYLQIEKTSSVGYVMLDHIKAS
jgi:hypothetical protein